MVGNRIGLLKRLIQVGFLLILIILLSVSLFPNDVRAVLLGDVDGNGKVDIIDIGIVIDNYAKSPIPNIRADVNSDGRIDIIDIGLVIDNYGKTSLSTPVPISNSQALAFPGAEGFGAHSRGGRGGTVYHVVNLNDSGSGSLRECVSATGSRYCVFDISGTINMASQMDVANPFITIAGESAPSPGITLKNNTLAIKTHDATVRHLRIRVGDKTPGDKDGFKFTTSAAFNDIADHMSVSWSIDESISTWYAGVRDITISNSIAAEALQNSIHSQGPHSKGILVGDLTKNISLINVMSLDNDDRNFLAKGGASVESINNIYYNWQEPKATGLGGAGTLATIIGNVYIKGPNTSAGSTALNSTNTATQQYISDIKMEGITNLGLAQNTNTKPVWSGLVSPDPSGIVESILMAHAGARPKDRDAVDNRILNDFKNRAGKIIDSQDQVGGWPTLAENHRAFPVPSNPNGDDNGDGYTNLENLLHQYAAALE